MSVRNCCFSTISSAFINSPSCPNPACSSLFYSVQRRAHLSKRFGDPPKTNFGPPSTPGGPRVCYGGDARRAAFPQGDRRTPPEVSFFLSQQPRKNPV